MNISMVNITYLITLVAGVTTASIWLGKLIITKAFDVGIEKYKADLARTTMEHQVRFSKLHEQRAEVIKSLFSKIIDLEGLLIRCTTIAQGPEYIYETERDTDARKGLIELINDFDQNKIYFSVVTVPKFEAIFKESWDIISQMAKVRRDGAAVDKYVQDHLPIPERYIRYDELWDKAFDRTTQEFRSLKEDLANEFRLLLGII